MEILVNNEQIEYEVAQYSSLLKQAYQVVLEIEKFDPDLEVGVTFVDNEQIRNLNNIYRGQDVPTDVLSFPQDVDEITTMHGVRLLGDVVISMPKVYEQANDYGHSVERETIYLAVHGLLHLLGYDHIDDQGKQLMREKEEAVLSKLGLGRD